MIEAPLQPRVGSRQALGIGPLKDPRGGAVSYERGALAAQN